MIMSKVADCLVSALSPSARIAVTYVEVTDSARELERSHLCGPTAGLVQAEALAGVALLGAELTQPSETVTLRLRVSGPVGGLLVEASSEGGLRGYTNVKVLDDLDACEELDAAQAFGEEGEVQVVRSLPGKILASGAAEVSPVSVTRAIEQYYRQSLQREVVVQIAALAYGGFIDGARGVLFERLPDGDPGRFEQILRLAEDSTLVECLEASASLKTICETVGLADCAFLPPKPLGFACHCSQERVEGMLGGLPAKEIEALAAAGEPAHIFCHMCGKGYRVAQERLAAILRAKG